MVLYHYDSNAILAHLLRNKSAEQHVEAYQFLMRRLLKCGLTPKLHKLDNEASQLLIETMERMEIPYQFVPPNMHCRNAAKRAICTFKNHFITGLCTVNPAFPLHLWD